MCLAVPAKVLAVRSDGSGRVQFGGAQLDVSLDLVDGVREGDYVIVHVGYAIARLDEAEAARTLALFEQLAAVSPCGPESSRQT